MKILLCDRSGPLAEAWTKEAKKYPHLDIEVLHGDIFQKPAKYIVSPANSFGFMDGGIDLAYTQRFGPAVQEELQRCIREIPETNGELLVGQAISVHTGDPDFPVLISAPTMRIPTMISDSIDVFLASRAAIRLANYLSDPYDEQVSILFPGMGTGVGQIQPAEAAKQMLKGINEALNPLPFPTTLGEAAGRSNGSLTSMIREKYFT